MVSVLWEFRNKLIGIVAMDGSHNHQVSIHTVALAFSLIDDHSSDFQRFLDQITEDRMEDGELECDELFPDCKV